MTSLAELEIETVQTLHEFAKQLRCFKSGPLTREFRKHYVNRCNLRGAEPNFGILRAFRLIEAIGLAQHSVADTIDRVASNIERKHES